ncbi:MAG: hypothetical protein VYA30_13015 [Myxococcota bacterium]|nr:hypothetical protein [Myxococcota bacterium]
MLSVAQAQNEDWSVDGRIASRSLYSTADGPVSKDVVFQFVDLDLEAEHMGVFDTSLTLDATILWDISEAQERRFGETQSFQQLRQLYLQQAVGQKWSVSAGRRIIFQAGNAWVDGLDIQLKLNNAIMVGAYGGLRPDPNSYKPTTTYQTLGTYSSYKRDGLNIEFGYNLILRDGLDRQFLYGRTHYRLSPGLYVNVYSVVDTLDEIEPVTFLSTLDYTPTKAVNLSLNYTRYSIEAYRNQAIYRNVVRLNQALLLGDEIIDLVYNRVRLSGSYRFWRRYYHYQTIEYKRRSQDRRQSWAYIIGIRNNNLWSTGTRLDLRTTLRNNFQSDSWLIAGDLEKDVLLELTLNLHGTVFDGRTIDRFTERGRTFDEAQRIYLMGGSLFWRPSRAHHLSLTYDGVYETDLIDQRNDAALFIHTGLFRYAYHF